MYIYYVVTIICFVARVTVDNEPGGATKEVWHLSLDTVDHLCSFS